MQTMKLSKDSRVASKDSRAKPIARKALGVENEGIVFSVFEDDTKLTVSDVYELVRAKKKLDGEPPLHDRTIRRALASLEKSGFIITAGKQNNSVLYAKQGTSFSSDPNGQQIIPLAGNLVTVTEFLRLFADLEVNPFKVKANVVSDRAALDIRRLMLFVVLTADSPGYNNQLKKVNRDLHAVLGEFEHAANTLRNFLNSPVWYEQYRERIAREVRQTDQTSPEIVKTARAVLTGEQ